jgi:diguanylate cyclase (GGDEF)-like protein
MTPELQERLERCKTLPSPPGVATQIISLANDPEADMEGIAKVLAADPAIATKVLRIANSSMYAQQRGLENLRQAMVVIGLNATISLALSFSLLKSWQGGGEGGGLDYPLYWRRALMSATVSGVVARRVNLSAAEELFLASLIQDIGMLALDRSEPDLYASVGPEQINQAALIEAEIEKIGVDHAAVGGWLLGQWNFPERLQQAVAASHDFNLVPASHKNALFARCVALTGLVSETFLDADGSQRFQSLATVAKEYFNLNNEALGEILEEVGNRIPDAEQVFDTKILIDNSAEVILEDAKEALMLRNLTVLSAVDTLTDKTTSLLNRTKELEKLSQRDTLTGLYNRRALDCYLATAFEDAIEQGQPLSFAFADLDGFKAINDTYGHQIGDQILEATAKILQVNVRSCDVVARYGGEEFVIAFPRTDSQLVQIICERIVKAFQQTHHNVGRDEDLTVTISIGMATFDKSSQFTSVEQIVQAADKALYTAKLQGKNRTVSFDLVA